VSKERCEQGIGPPSFCWHCSRQLQRAKGIGKGLFYFRRVQDTDGTIYRVHDDCVAACEEFGMKRLRAALTLTPAADTENG
jgi:hypothetical protein